MKSSIVICLFALASAVFGCGVLDLIVVIDSSAQVGAAPFLAEKQFCLALALKIGISATAVNFGGVAYSSASEVNDFLPLTASETDAALFISNLTYIGNASAPGTALWSAYNELSANHRNGAAQAILLLSGSSENEGFNVLSEAATIKQNGVQIFGLGAGQFDANTLQQVVNGPSNYFTASQFASTQALIPSIIKQRCSDIPSTSGATAGTTSPYTTSSGGSVPCGDDTCAPGAQCCSDSIHPGSDYYCCAGTGSCCHGACCPSNQHCSTDINDGVCVNGGEHSSGDPYTTTAGSTKCGDNLCAPGAQCCSDSFHTGSDYYCCSGTEECCRGSCCPQGASCSHYGLCGSSSTTTTSSSSGGRGWW